MSRLTDEQIGVLMSPINSGRIASRTVSGRRLSYVEAYDIKATLIRLFGFGGFSVEVIDSKIIEVRTAGTHPDHVNNDGGPKTPQVIATSTVRLTIFAIGPDGRDAVYTETAVGSNSGHDIGDTADNAIKSAASDALKRCAIYLGSQFGLSLYNDGGRQEIVQVIFEPEQREQLLRMREQQQPNPGTQEALTRATSQEVSA